MAAPARFAFLLRGPSLAGKSTTCERSAAALGAALISADAINAQRGLPFGGEALPEPVWAETARTQLQSMHGHAAGGRSAVVDDTMCYRWLRDRFRAEAGAARLEPELLVLGPERSVLLARHSKLSGSRRASHLVAATLRRAPRCVRMAGARRDDDRYFGPAAIRRAAFQARGGDRQFALTIRGEVRVATRPDEYWFPAKRYGWGWGPPRVWQGWTVLGVFFALVAAGAFLLLPRYGNVVFLGYSVLLCVLLILVCWLKGEPPRWRWGRGRDA